MSDSSILLADCVRVNGRFQRSIHLDKDYKGKLFDSEYHITSTAIDMLRRIDAGIGQDATTRSWTLTGPYGVGKSAFGVFLSRLLCDPLSMGEQVRQRLKTLAPVLSQRLAEYCPETNGDSGFFPVLLTARRAPAARCIAEALVEASKNFTAKNTKSARETIIQLCNDTAADLDTNNILKAIQILTETACSIGYSGVLLLIDEMGKLFEYAARYPQNGDLFILQALAESANRSASKPFIMAGFLHQSFEEYAVYLDMVTRREWAKIQGRFEDVPFVEPIEQTIHLVAHAIERRPGAFSKDVEKCIMRVIGRAEKTGLVPLGMRGEQFEKAALSAYPLHPLTLVALPHFFRRFAQNERSLFSYLCSQEPGGFQGFIARTMVTRNSVPFIRLSDLFDYFTENIGASLYRQAHARRLLETLELLDQQHNLEPLQIKLLKTIGLLTTLGEVSPLRPTQEMIIYAMGTGDLENSAAEAALMELRNRSLITYRNFNHTFRIWEGSDVDIDSRISEGERQTRDDIELARIIADYANQRPLVARRHSFITGALRFFPIVYVDTPDQVSELLTEPFAADGRIIVCLIESPQAAEAFIYQAQQATTSTAQLFAIPKQIGPLRAVATELTALRWVQKNTPELRDDRVARRELSLRMADVELLFSRYLSILLDPRSEPLGSGCTWYWCGDMKEVYSSKDISNLISEVCDTIYHQSPKIRNELIVRRTVSPAVSGARRNLLERMLHHENQEYLGIDGYPPERSIYESVLNNTGIHRVNESGGGYWRFAAPLTNSEAGLSLCPIWNKIAELVFSSQPEPMPIDHIYAVLSAPPFGVFDGLHPILISAFFLANRNEATLYREGTFLPEPNIADFEVLLRCPAMFALAGSRLIGQRLTTIQRLSKGLGTAAQTVPVVRELFLQVKGLNDFAWRTQRLDRKTLELRRAFDGAKSPEKFLFEDIPRALGYEPIGEEQTATKDMDTFFEDLNRAIQQWQGVAQVFFDQACKQLLGACGQPVGDGQQLEGWLHLRQQASQLLNQITDSKLRAFVQRIVESDSTLAGMETVIALVANLPFQNWNDRDADGFLAAVEPIGRAFRQTLAMAAPERWKRMAADLTETQQIEAVELFSKIQKHINRLQKPSVPGVLLTALARMAEELERKDQS